MECGYFADSRNLESVWNVSRMQVYGKFLVFCRNGWHFTKSIYYIFAHAILYSARDIQYFAHARTRPRIGIYNITYYLILFLLYYSNILFLM
jgi:hypothetical protein